MTLRSELEALLGDLDGFFPEETVAESEDHDAGFSVEDEAARLAASLDFDVFCKALVPTITGGRYADGWFLRELRDRLQRFAFDVMVGRSPRLIVMAPPRHGKSMHLELLIAWLQACLAPGTKSEVMVVAATGEMALDRVSNARSHFRTAMELGITNVGLDESTRAKGKWMTDARGSVYAAGIKGTITSKGANVLVIDDPVKGVDDVLSPASRDKAWRAYTSDIRSRVQPGGGVIIIQTRWHEDDLTGRLLEQHDVEGWEVVRYPAIAEVDEAHRKAGEALHPSMWPLHLLERRRATSQTADWLAQYQQRPTSDEGEVWQREWWGHWTLQPNEGDPATRPLPANFNRVAVACDLTMGSTSGNGSMAALQVWGQAGDSLFLIDEDRGQWGFEETVSRITALTQKHKATHAIIEAKALGIAAIQTLRKTLRGVRVVSDDAKGSKTARAYDAAVFIEKGQVFVPARGIVPWVDEWLDEVTGFPTARYDDRVDAASMAIRKMLAAKSRPVLMVGSVGGDVHMA